MGFVANFLDGPVYSYSAGESDSHGASVSSSLPMVNAP